MKVGIKYTYVGYYPSHRRNTKNGNLKLFPFLLSGIRFHYVLGEWQRRRDQQQYNIVDIHIKIKNVCLNECDTDSNKNEIIDRTVITICTYLQYLQINIMLFVITVLGVNNNNLTVS